MIIIVAGLFILLFVGTHIYTVNLLDKWNKEDDERRMDSTNK